MNVNLAAVKKDRPATDGGFSNDNTDNWLARVPINATFYCKYRDNSKNGYHLHERMKTWEQGPVATLIIPDAPQEWSTSSCYVETAEYSKIFVLVHIYEEEDST